MSTESVGVCVNLTRPNDGGNAGVPAVVPAGTTGLTLFDDNTSCATGAAPSPDAVVDGGTYVFIGLAPNSDPSARTSLLLQLGV